MSHLNNQIKSNCVPGKRDIRAQCDRITHSSDFDITRRSRDFLQFIVQETLAGNEAAISQNSLACSVFGRGEDFDPTTDPIVRMQASRVRRSLEHYYLTEGANDPVLIDLPKGTYVPTFVYREPAQPAAHPTLQGLPQENKADSWPTLLVTPFENLTNRPDVDFVAKGLASDLAAELSRYTFLHVFLSPDSKNGTSGSCSARFHLTGTLLPRGSGLKVNVHLLDLSTSQQIWAYSRSCPEGSGLGEALDALVPTAAAIIAEEHGVLFSRLVGDLPKTTRPDAGAYEAILRYHHFELTQTPHLFGEALSALRLAVKTHPDCALCWSSLARLRATHWSLGFPGDVLPIEDSLAAARRGVALNPSDTNSRLILAFVHLMSGEVDEARGEADTALRLNQGSIYWLDVIGYLLTLSGDWDRGPDLIRKAAQANPFHRKFSHGGLWLDALHRNDPPAALAAAGEFGLKGSFWQPLMLAVALVALDRMDEAAKQVEILVQLQPDFPQRMHWYITRYVKFDDLVSTIEQALHSAGLVESPSIPPVAAAPTTLSA